MDRFQQDLQESLSKLGMSLKGIAELSGVKGKIEEERKPVSRPERRENLSEGREFWRKVESVRSRRRDTMRRPVSESRRSPVTRTSALMEDLREISRKLLGEESISFPPKEVYHDGQRLSMTTTVDRVPPPYTAIPATELVKTFRGVADVADVISTRLTEAQRYVGKGQLAEMSKVLRALAEIANEAEEKAKELEKDPEAEFKPEEEPMKKMGESINDMVKDLEVAGKFAGNVLREAGLAK